jgi:hypothetical protein
MRPAAAVTPFRLAMQQALQRRGYERTLVGCYAKLGCGNPAVEPRVTSSAALAG